jgi:hypothetical protein
VNYFKLSVILLVIRLTEEKIIAKDGFEFVVEFVWIDGTLFKLGPCCGATEAEMPPVWQFPFMVRKIDGSFKVKEEAPDAFQGLQRGEDAHGQCQFSCYAHNPNDNGYSQFSKRVDVPSSSV